MAGKTVPELGAQTAPVQDADLLVSYRGVGPLKSVTAATLKTYAQSGSQPLDADLTAIAALTSAADRVPYATGAGTWSLATLTSFARALLATASNSAFLTALGQIASSAIDFLQSGTGAVTRTMQAKGRDTISIMDFGTAGDGTTDDTTKFQAVLDAYPNTTVIHGAGKSYKISAPLVIPAGRMVTLRDMNIVTVGDIVAIQGPAAGTVTFFEMNGVLIDTSSHTTVGRRAVDISRFSNFNFRRVWVFPSASKTVAFYGAGTGGTSPYYGSWDTVYTGNSYIGIDFADAAPSAGVNSVSIKHLRAQPGTGNIGVRVGVNSQNIRILHSEFENSPGGTGVKNSGANTLIAGCRFESMNIGIQNVSGATKLTLNGNYNDSCTTYFSNAGTNTAFIENGAIDAATVGVEGSFAPTLGGSTTDGTTTYGGARFGYYRKFGTQLTFQFYLPWTATTASGFLEAIIDLPYVFKTGNINPVVQVAADGLTYTGQLVAIGIPGTNRIRFYAQASGAALSTLSVDTAAELRINGTVNID